MSTGLENSKEFVNFYFKVNLTDDDVNPVQTVFEIPLEHKQEETKSMSTQDIDIYNTSAIFVAPMFVLHSNSYRSMTLRLSLALLVEHSVDACRTQLSLLNR